MSAPALSASIPSSTVEISAITSTLKSFFILCIRSRDVKPPGCGRLVASMATISAPLKITCFAASKVGVIRTSYPAMSILLIPIIGTFTASLTAFVSLGPLTLIPTAPPFTAALAISAIISGP